MKDFFKKYRIDIIIFGVALCARIFLFGVNFHASNGDLLGTIHGDDGYFELSRGLLAGHGFSWDVQEPFLPNTLRTPLYIYFISASTFVFGNYGFAIVIQIILGALIPVLGRHIALALISRERVALWVGILLAFEPYLVLFSSIFYTETFFIFLFLIFILIFLKYLKEGTTRALIWSSFILGLATLTKTTVQYLPLLLFFLILWNFRNIFSRKKLLGHAILFMAVFLVTLSPWLYRNYLEFGVVGMTAQPAYNLNVYLVPSVLSLENGTSFNSEVAKFVTTEESSGNKITLANSPEYTRRAWTVLKDHPTGLVKSMAITMVTFFTHDGMLTVLQHAGYVPDVYMGKPAISLIFSSPLTFLQTMLKYIQTPLVLVLVLRIVWIVITLFFLIGLVRFMKVRKCDAISLFILITILYFVATSAIGGLGVNARYRMPLDPILFTFALTGFIYIRNVILPKHKKTMTKDSTQRRKMVEAAIVWNGPYRIDESGRPFLIEKEVFVANETEHESGINWLKSFLKRWPKLYYSVWHVFCPVLMLRHGPRMIKDFIPKDAIVVDLGSGPERLGDSFLNVDVYPFPEVDIVADAEHLPFKDNSLEALVSESMLEHVPNPRKVAAEMARVLKSGGVIYVSAPFIHPYHASPDDFNRWTISGLKELFPDLEIIKSGVRSGPWSAFLMFLAYWLGVVFSLGSRKVAPFLAHIFMLVLGPLKYLDFFFTDIPGAEAVAAHLYIIAKKK